MLNDLYNLLEGPENSFDWNQIEACIAENSSELNKLNNDGCFLADMLPYLENGKTVLEISKLFVKHGFDVSANQGKNGAYCMEQTCLRHDRWAPVLLEYFLEIGSDPLINLDPNDPYEPSDLMGNIDWNLDQWTLGDYERANLYESCHLMGMRAIEHKDFHGIRSAEDCLGHILTKVELLADSTLKDSYEYTGIMVLHFGDIPLQIRHYPDMVINPYYREDWNYSSDVSTDYAEYIGSSLCSIRFESALHASLSFSNHKTLVIYAESGSDFKTITAHVKKTTDENELPEPGTVIRSIYVSGRKKYSENTRLYDESDIYLCAAEKLYHIGSYGRDYSPHNLYSQTISANYNFSQNRYINLHDIRFLNSFQEEDRLFCLEFSCSSGYLYLFATEFSDVRLYLSENRQRDPHVLHYYREDGKQIIFLSALETPE